jgi:hypothetical protein
VDINDLLAQVPLDQFAAQLGIESPQAEGVARQAITALVGGMGANAQDPDRAASLNAALGQHAGGAFPEGTDLAKVDTEDGNAIVSNIFGGKEGDVIGQLGGLLGDGGGDSLFAKALPLLAPLVLRWIGGALSGEKEVTGNASRIPGVIPGTQDDSGGGLEDRLGGLLGGGGGGGGGGAGDLLGGLLGGGGGGGAAGALGGLLGGEGGGADLGGLLDGLLGDGKKA